MEDQIKPYLPSDKSLAGVFPNMSTAERGYGMLTEMGYGEDEISLLMSDEAHTRYFPAPELKAAVVGDRIVEGPGLGSVIGAGTGTMLGAILGEAAVPVLSGIGLVVVGPLAAILTGAALGGMCGGILGSLLGIGLSEDHAKDYAKKIAEGRILIALNPRSEEDARMISREWEDIGGEVIASTVAPYSGAQSWP
jgi:hypothetical protein